MIKIDWLDENKNVVLWQFPEKYDRETFIEAEKASSKLMADTNSYMVDIVMMANRSDLDGTSNVIDALLAMMCRLPDETGLIVFVAPPMVARIMRTTWNTINGGLNTNQLQFASSLEEAQLLVTHLRAVA